MIRLALAIGFLAIFGLVGVWLISYLERNFWKKDSNKDEKVNLNEQKTKEEKTN